MSSYFIQRSVTLSVVCLTLLSLEPRSSHSQTAPAARAHHQLVYHAGADRVYLIGGSTRRNSGYHTFNDVWHWNGSQWAGDPALPFPRSSHRVVYLARRNSLILFGGAFGQAVRAEGVLWEWQPDGWKAVGGHHHAASTEPGMCYDQKRDRLVIFGGWDAAAQYRGDTWEWSGGDLVRVDSTGPSPRAGHAFLFDPVRERCLLFGGRSEEGYLADTWEWDGASWRRLEVAGPSARWFFGAASDSVNRRIVIFGGGGPGAHVIGRDDTGDLGDTWAWNGVAWTRLSTDGPDARSMAKLAYTQDGIILFGGRVEVPAGFQDRADTWLLSGRSWRRLR